MAKTIYETKLNSGKEIILMPSCPICNKFPNMTDQELYIHKKYFHKANDSQFYSVNTCPDCGASIISQEGCLLCQSCGWSKC